MVARRTKRAPDVPTFFKLRVTPVLFVGRRESGGGSSWPRPMSPHGVACGSTARQVGEAAGAGRLVGDLAAGGQQILSEAGALPDDGQWVGGQRQRPQSGRVVLAVPQALGRGPPGWGDPWGAGGGGDALVQFVDVVGVVRRPVAGTGGGVAAGNSVGVQASTCPRPLRTSCGLYRLATRPALPTGNGRASVRRNRSEPGMAALAQSNSCVRTCGAPIVRIRRLIVAGPGSRPSWSAGRAAPPTAARRRRPSR